MADICGYTDRFYHDKGWWRRWCDLAPGHPGSHFEVRVQRSDHEMVVELARARRAREDAEIADAEDDEPPVTITQPAEPVEAATIKRASPKRVIQAALRGGFTVEAWVSKTFERGTVFKGGERAGQRRADKTVEHLWVTGKVPGLAAFWLRFDEGRFKDGFVWDSAGWPVELFFDYTPTYLSRKAAGMSEQEGVERGARLSAAYNDGEFFATGRPRLVKTGADLDEWLADLIPGFEPRKKKTAEPEPVVDGFGMIEGEWHG